ncbi:pre-mRNA-splicing factor Cwc24p [[Candida] jaroonii]|uniref:Pre-mRNA-splicing factor Cwc24p n=1 Tax=[Candida] jaroonii TaxID=467808 RepID=A0ACA9YC19_9ASCO|nr:pre-mRNA-splicing factor Cwc24p [[Candida] jaroonii]
MFKKRNIKKDKESIKRKIIEEEGEAPETLLKESINKLKRSKIETKPTEFQSDKGKEVLKEVSKELTHTDSATMTITKSDTKSSLKAAPVNVRTTTITDFQPDVCKDFKQTGYCGYGDTCKFLHIRGESTNKTPVVKEWENVNKKEKKDTIPFKCVLCKDDYKTPVKTICNHLYCKDCFFKRLKTKKTCFICNEDTKGICSPVPAKEFATLMS